VCGSAAAPYRQAFRAFRSALGKIVKITRHARIKPKTQINCNSSVLGAVKKIEGALEGFFESGVASGVGAHEERRHGEDFLVGKGRRHVRGEAGCAAVHGEVPLHVLLLLEALVTNGAKI
jgi:hypothetical protein